MNSNNSKRFSDDTSASNPRKFKKQKNKHSNVNSLYVTDKYEDIPLPKKGRTYTVSIAIPGSILDDTCLNEVLRSNLVVLISRTAAMYSVDEIVIYNDHLWKKCSEKPNRQKAFIEMMRQILYYQECPPYLRKQLCPISKSLEMAGLFAPIGSVHHLKNNEWCPYREGVVVSTKGKKEKLVDVGLGRNITVTDEEAPVGVRVTVSLPDCSRVMDTPIGDLVTPQEVREKTGLYWGYEIRTANSLAEVINPPDDEEEYDLFIGTSDKGVDVDDVQLPKFKKALIVFGGVDGLEKAIEKDPKISVDDPKDYFHQYINVFPYQATKTIRTEEAIFVALGEFSRKFRTLMK